MSGEELLALAERCEAASGPDRLLDASIASIIRLEKVPHWARTWTGEWKPTEYGSVVLMEGDGKPGPHFMSREYTASIDAALTLVPEGWWLAGLNYSPEDFRSPQDREWHAEFGGPVTWATYDEMPEPQFDCEGGNAATPALALCAAALRARAQSMTPTAYGEGR